MIQHKWQNNQYVRRRGPCCCSLLTRLRPCTRGVTAVSATSSTRPSLTAASSAEQPPFSRETSGYFCSTSRSDPNGCGSSSNSGSTGDAGTHAHQLALARRQLLLGLACAAGGALVCTSPASAAGGAPPAPPSATSFLQPLLPPPTPDLVAQLEGRSAIFQPGVAWALRNRERQLFYPPWMAGEWEVTARFAAASFPQGRRLLGRTVPGVLKGSMVVALPDVGAAMDAPLRYRARFVVSPEEGGVVADRVFNVRQLMDAFYGFEVTRKVEYEPLKNPTRMTVVYATPRQDKSVISEDLRKAELIINNRISDWISPSDWVCAELFRQISQASAQGFVGDYETISRYTLLQPGAVVDGAVATSASAVQSSEGPARAGDETAMSPGADSATPPGDATAAAIVVGVGAQVKVLQRVAAFLQPQDAAFFEAGNQAVAAYDYVYDLRRVA